MPSRHHRVVRGDDYRRIVREGRRVGGAFCITHAVFHAGGEAAGADRPARFGFIVSKAVGGAVVRNRVRRRLKDIARRNLSNGFSGADVVFRALPASAAASFAELQTAVDHSLSRVAAMAPRRDGAAAGAGGRGV